MRKPTSSFAVFSIVLSLLLPGVSISARAQTSDSIGLVVITKGLVEAVDASGTVRQLNRRSELFQEDTLVVGPDGYAQVRMFDDALITLKSDTEFAFVEYDFDSNTATPDSATMSMIRGGFMTISGTIGDADEDRYRIDTPYASIGIRGTVHSAVIENGVLYTGVSDGGTTITNNQGSIDAGIGADYDFTETRENTAPRGLLEAPPQLSLVDLTPPVVEEDTEDADDAAAAPVVAAAPAAADTEDNSESDTAPDFAILGTTTAAENNQSLAAVAPPPVTDTVVVMVASANNVTAPATGTEAPAIATEVEVSPTLFSRSANELTNTGSSVAGTNTDASNSSGNGSTTTDTATTDRGNSSGNGNSSDSGSTSTDRGNSSTTTDRGNSSGNGNSSSSGSTSTDTATTDRGNSSSTTDRGNSSGNGNSSGSGSTGTDTATTDRGNSSTTTDRGNSSGNGNSSGGGSTGTDTAATDRGNSSTTTDRGNSSGNGNPSGNNSSGGGSTTTDTATTDRGNSNNGNANGNSSGGNDSTTTDTATTDRGNSGGNGNANGNSSSGSGSTDTDTATTDRGNSGGNGNANGNSSSGSGSTTTDTATTDRGNSSSDGSTTTRTDTAADNSSSSGTSSSRSVAARVGLERSASIPVAAHAQLLHWGAWDSPLTRSPRDTALAISAIVENDTALLELYAADIASLSGTATYQQTSRFQGIDESGASLQQVSMAFDVNFVGGPGAISNGHLHVLDADFGVWQTTFSGDLSGATAQMTNVDGSFAGTRVTGAIRGVFVGTGSTPDFFTGFVLQAGDQSVQGLGVLDQHCTTCN